MRFFSKVVISAFMLIVFLGWVHPARAALSTAGSTSTWTPDGNIFDLAESADGESLYVGGNFTTIGQFRGPAVVVDTSTGTPKDELAPIGGLNGDVRVALPDGSGGWFVGGQNFTYTTSTARELIHLKSDGTIDNNFLPDFNGVVTALKLDGSTLYVGGTFTSVNSTTRNNIAALSTSDGSLTSFNPGVTNTFTVFIDALEVDDDNLYISGQFNTVSGTTRNHLAAVAKSDGSITSWNPNPNARVYDLERSGTTLYAGGVFTTIGGASRTRLASLSTGSSTANSWNPGVGGGHVFDLELDGTTLYIGGTFTSVNTSTTRNRMAALDTTTDSGTATSFNPNIGANTVYAISVDSGVAYAAGDFTTVNGSTTRKYFAAFDTDDGTTTSLNIDVNPHSTEPTGREIYINSDDLFIGGAFDFVGDYVTRNYIAEIDLTTGEATDWNPNAGNSVRSIEVSGSTVYLGGSFTSMNGGTTRNRVAAVDATNGTITSWNPNFDSTVYDLELSGSTLFAVGGFTTVNGSTTRNYAAGIDTSSGTATSFDPDLDSDGNTVTVDGNTVYIGGYFENVNGGTSRNYAAAFNKDTGVVNAWNPNLDDAPDGIAISSSTAYMGGCFTTANGGTTRNSAAAVDTTNGTVTSFNPNFNNCVSNVEVRNATVYYGGYFTTMGGSSSYGLLGFDITSGATSWTPTVYTNQDALYLGEDTLYYAGRNTTGLHSGYDRILIFTGLDEAIVDEENNNSGSGSSSSAPGPAIPQPWVCTTTTPFGTPDLFQINREKNTAKLFFTPVNDHVAKYHVVYGFLQGDERFGQLSADVSAEANKGVQSIVIGGLDPRASYWFKVAPVNDCAVGTWSNWLRVDRAKNKQSIFYRYWPKLW